MHIKKQKLSLLLLLVLIAGICDCAFLLLVLMEGLSSGTFEVLASFVPTLASSLWISTSFYPYPS
jgi:uncharacterized membrane-anchored protein YitT (DUF2179 family)